MPSGEITIHEIDRRVGRLEKTIQEIDVDRERLAIWISELAVQTEASHKLALSQLASLVKSTEEQKKQSKLLMTVVALLVVQLGPTFVMKVVKAVAGAHFGVDF